MWREVREVSTTDWFLSAPVGAGLNGNGWDGGPSQSSAARWMVVVDGFPSHRSVVGLVPVEGRCRSAAVGSVLKKVSGWLSE